MLVKPDYADDHDGMRVSNCTLQHPIKRLRDSNSTLQEDSNNTLHHLNKETDRQQQHITRSQKEAARQQLQLLEA